jgi:hypothetical protein
MTVKGPIHSKLNCAVKLYEKLNWMFSGTAQVSHQVCQFLFVSSVCLLVRVTIVDKNKALVCCLLGISAIMLSEKKKKKRKMWYLKRNISCDAHLLNQLLETDVPWDDAFVVSAGLMRKLWDFLKELRSSLRERRLERTVLRPGLLSVKTAQFAQFFSQVWRHTVKSLSLTESV